MVCAAHQKKPMDQILLKPHTDFIPELTCAKRITPLRESKWTNAYTMWIPSELWPLPKNKGEATGMPVQTHLDTALGAVPVWIKTKSLKESASFPHQTMEISVPTQSFRMMTVTLKWCIHPHSVFLWPCTSCHASENHS